MPPKESDLITEPIPKLIRELAVPAGIGAFFNTMFNVVDTFYAGLISTDALAALSISFPLFFIIITVGSGLSTGATALVANALGAGDRQTARLYAVQSISFALILSAFITLAGLLLSPALFRLLGAQELYLSLSLSYMNVIFWGTLFFILAFVINAILNALGDTKSFRNFLIVGFFLNVLLDPWFMFGWLGFPQMGIAGVALATILIEFGGVLYLGKKLLGHHLLEGFRWRELLPRRDTFLPIASQSIPASLNMLTIGIGIFVITYFISAISKAGVAAYGIATRVEQIFLLPTIGLTVAAITLVGHNNGAGKLERVKETLRVCLRYGLYIMALGTIVIFLLAPLFMNMFTKDPEVIAIGVHYLRIAAFITFAYALLFIHISALQGLKKPAYAVWVGLARQIIAPLIVFWLFANKLGFGLNGIWWGIFGITWSAALVTLWYSRHTLRQLNLEARPPSKI